MIERIAVMGAGAIGGSIGACLIREGFDVTLIDQWAAHVDKMKRNGLRLTDLKEEFTVKVKAFHISEASSIREGFDTVYLSVKSYDTRWSAHLVEPLLKPTGFVLPAQNALNDELVASIVGYPRTVGCVPSISAGVYEPGHIVRTDPMVTHCFTVGELYGLITPRVRGVVEALKALGPSDATTNIWGARWGKMLVNCMGNALAGIIGPDASKMTGEQREAAGIIRAAAGCEVVRVAEALGVVVEPLAATGVSAAEFAGATTLQAVVALRDRMDQGAEKRSLSVDQINRLGVPGRPSLLQDVIKGRRTEVEELNGHVVRKGKEVGVPTPVNGAIVDTLNRIEAGSLRPDPSNVDLLRPYLPR